MAFRAFAFFALFVAVQAAQASDVELTEADRALVQQSIVKAYADPRVAEIVRQANAEQRSVSVELEPAAPAPAYELAPSTAVLAEEPAAKNKSAVPYTHLGLAIDAGVPDVIGASVVYRPWKWLRVFGGGTYNGAAAGVRAGLTLLPPVFFPILPTATVEAGHYFEGDANGIAQKFGASDESPWLRRVNYDYVNGHLGLEIGSQNRFVFYIHGGVSYVHGTIHDFAAKLQESIGSDGTSSFKASAGKDPTFSVLAPSGKIGFLIYFL